MIIRETVKITLEKNPADFSGKLYQIFKYPINLLKAEQRTYKTGPEKGKVYLNRNSLPNMFKPYALILLGSCYLESFTPQSSC